MLLKSLSAFRKRLSDIHENTWIPIILIIEDIDTLLTGEKGTQSDPLSQALTTFFEGVGSLPLTVITSTNNPEVIPERHLRPNRLDLPVGFQYPLDPGVLVSMLRRHLQRIDIEALRIEGGLLEKVVEIARSKILKFTPSHIESFCRNLYGELEFLDVNTLSERDLQKITQRTLVSVIVPVKDMTKREESMQKWLSNLTSRDEGSMGFTAGASQ